MVGVPFRPASAGAWHLPTLNATDLVRAWRSLSLAQRYLIVALLTLAVFTALSSIWVSEQIARIGQSRAQSALAPIHDIVEPLVQTLPATKTLPPEATAALDSLLSAPGFASQISVMRLWRPNGELVYESDRRDASVPAPTAAETDLFEMNVPLYKTGTREIVGIAQLYSVSEQAQLRRARTQSWLVLAVLALALVAVPFNIVQNASRQIEAQQRIMAEQKAEEERLIARSEAMRNLVEVVHRRGMEHNERLLRRIGSDLHDGPAQHLALVLLRLDELAPLLEKPGKSGPGTSGSTLETIRRATSDALKEIRHISAGLALPELQKISVADALMIAVRGHQRATGTRVETTIANLPARLPLPITICLYRFAQEALNNAFRHAAGNGQRLSASYEGATISVEVADSGPGFAVDRLAAGGDRLGLSGLRYRVESLGGSLKINSAVGRGARLSVQFRNPLA